MFQVPLEGFSALQGISGSQKFQIHKAYGSPDHLPSAHTWYVFFPVTKFPIGPIIVQLWLSVSYRLYFIFWWIIIVVWFEIIIKTEFSSCSFNQLDLPEYPSKQHLEERLLLAIHEASEGFGFGWEASVRMGQNTMYYIFRLGPILKWNWVVQGRGSKFLSSYHVNMLYSRIFAMGNAIGSFSINSFAL